jgi:K+-sensing histidine kinase KdpD
MQVIACGDGRRDRQVMAHLQRFLECQKRFVRNASHHTGHPTEGSGLGLAICRSIAMHWARG